ncbi:2-succinyl-5-enolpyruvyl-6-hydroxy-3-cyclohexene-1-carboxylic-acid synthase [Alicyclobacillus ferrooxydans]|uniref:2-succinyl-5-enolpyruvyl-6-hydroxy-3-cyclohexene-1-carboxylate synthase n=1 Tax=Alicyclobacillus ferrooxydans TaxID=471514 RepID=A0A0P9CD83_9BACL|nr:2-succinyl-5-enolpyruvyl-6-hydroxy-3-cyclohexene-1-carboxylic-acid synthase [Alicyclobacillus ferrooxydans]KPV43695.1 hypothetical protein AN477_11055 [Alicyclobacillus ferrooxydans]
MENANLSVVHTFIDELWQFGVRHICISPGSRSTPVTISAATHGGFQLHTLLDERSSAFFALGLARRLAQPVLLVCTSGTAAANYHPAVMEALQSRVPLLVLTSDRPPELYHVGANQTVPQIEMFGTHVKWSVQMPVPEDTKTIHRHAAATAWRAAAVAMSQPQGPVHINWPFREPLIPSARIPNNQETAGADKLQRGPLGLSLLGVAELEPAASVVLGIASLIDAAKRPLIVAGPQEGVDVAGAVLRLASKIQAPILADPLSQVRTHLSASDRVEIVDTYDWFIGPDFNALPQPDLILRFGRTPTSKGLLQYLGSLVEARQVVCSEGPEWMDASVSATDVVISDPTRLIDRLLEQPTQNAFDGGWLQRWETYNQRVRALVQEAANASFFDGDATEQQASLPFEGRLWLELAPHLVAGANVFVGNSMPIRDMDGFFLARCGAKCQLRVFGNRGVSGIDGIVSSAAGTAAAYRERTILVLGDVSFYHDLNGLLAVMREKLPLSIILVHNDGGGIFTGLPQAEVRETFDYFQTPHGLDFRSAVEMYDGLFLTASDWTTFSNHLFAAMQTEGVAVVELRTSAHESTRRRRWIRQLVREIEM